MSRVLSAISWRTVRVLGGLQVLTKASYFMLVFVPVLAAIWPALRGYINRHNQELSERKLAVDDLVLALEEVQTNDFSLNLNVSLDPAISNLQRIIGEVESFVIPDSDMPDVWAVAFFSSLLVVIGHAVYESLAPDLVKRFSQEEYAAFELTRYTNHPTAVQLEQARNLILEEISIYNSKLGIPAGFTSFDDENAPRLDWSQQKANPLDTISFAASIQYERALGSGRVNLSHLVKDTPFESQFIEIVGHGVFSRAFWRLVRINMQSISSFTDLLSPMVISLSAYFVALVGLFWIVLRQSVTVMEAANWKIPSFIYALANAL